MRRVGHEVIEFLDAVAVANVDILADHEGFHRAAKAGERPRFGAVLAGPSTSGEGRLGLRPPAEPSISGERTAGERRRSVETEEVPSTSPAGSRRLIGSVRFAGVSGRGGNDQERDVDFRVVEAAGVAVNSCSPGCRPWSAVTMTSVFRSTPAGRARRKQAELLVT